MAVNVKMGVDIGGFTSGIREGQQILKGLNAEMKAADAEFKATGNAEQKMTQQTKTLNSQLNVQKGIFDQAQKALKKMEEAGIKPTDAAYQKMYATMMNAKAGMSEAQAQLNSLGTGAETAAGKTEKLAQSMNSLNKKVSLEQVITGISTITHGLEGAARKAIELGESIWNSIMESAKWADDTATMAQMYGIDIDTFQRMQKLVTNGMDTSVETMLKSMDKLSKGVGKDSTEVIEALASLGLAQTNQGKNGGITTLITEDQTELFWEAGRALMEMGKSFDKDAASNALFGKSWRELVPLFSQYKSLEEYNKALEDVNVVSEESVNALVELNDKYSELKGNFETLKTEVMGALAPALTTAADALNNVLESVLEYLRTEEGKQMLSDLQKNISELFSGIKDISAQDIVEGFKGAIDTVTGALQWFIDNKDGVVTAIEAIAGVFGTLKLATFGFQIAKIVSGLKDLLKFGGGGGGDVVTTTGGGGASWFSGISTWLTGAGAKLAEVMNGGLGNVLPFAGDWLVHQSPLATVFSGMESLPDLWNRLQREQQERTETFADNWNPNSEDANVIAKGFGEMIKVWENQVNYWTDIFEQQRIANEELRKAEEEEQKAANQPKEKLKLNRNASWTDWVLGDEWSAGEILEAIEEASKEQPVPVTVEPTPTENAAENIVAQVGEVKVPAQLVVNGFSFGWGMGGGGTGGAGVNMPTQRANGLPFVPYDGYLASLHKGERVVPAREVSSRSYNSNLYVENMNMNGGADAAGLAAAMAAAQRRTMSAYGS